MQNLLNFINSLNGADVTNFLKFLGYGGVSISAVLQTIKHKLRLFEAKHEKYLLGLQVLFAAVATAVEKWLSHNPDHQLFWHFLAYLAASLTIYHLPLIGTKSVYTKYLVPFLDWLQTNQIIKAGTGIQVTNKTLTNPTIPSPTLTSSPAPAAPADGSVSLRS